MLPAAARVATAAAGCAPRAPPLLMPSPAACEPQPGAGCWCGLRCSSEVSSTKLKSIGLVGSAGACGRLPASGCLRQRISLLFFTAAQRGRTGRTGPGFETGRPRRWL